MTQDNDDKIDRLFNAADEAWEEGDEAKAFDLFIQCAELGDVAAMLNAGYFLDEGLGVKADKTAAMNWYLKAHELGDSSAANNIAILHREQNNMTGAFEWFGKAVALGDADANVELAKIYLHGLGIPKDEAKAREHLEAALTFEVDHEDADDDIVYISEAGHDEAAELLAALNAKG
jgi:uncharacterized protein